ncbi:uncharacterized protein LOC131855392 [Achroia grisella]|uniref:uncharacterized protein LOC131855392 n=1 Tax=Achroia grisella TaxID=688607 RepID=UPI0027D2AD22|nr:uncharacterized protein LOC131855392 [Achroia grisella]
MKRTQLVGFCFLAIHFQIILSQSPMQYNILNRQLPEVIEALKHYVVQPTLPPIVEAPCDAHIPLPLPSPSSTTIITDCSPTACKNLANTLQLMIVCNLLQNTNGGSELALQLASPIINELFTSPVLSCGCANPFATNVVSPRVVSPTVIPPSVVTPTNVISELTNPVSPVSPFLLSGNLLQSLLSIK